MDLSEKQSSSLGLFSLIVSFLLVNSEIVAAVAPVCSAGEVATDCYNACRATCKTRIYNDRFCTQECRKGCDCPEGRLRHDNGTCVPVYECSTPDCKYQDTEYYSNCGTACELTCENYKNPPEVCTQQCVDKCFCYKGFVRAPDGSCVKPENCPAPITCPANEVYYKCKDERCYTDCNQLYTSRPCPSLSADCYNPGCLCKEGWYRNSSGVCVTEEQCGVKIKCPADQVYSKCIDERCYTTCNHLFMNRACPSISEDCFKPGCLCKPGSYWNKEGICVPESQCPPNTCPSHERPADCYNACRENSCSTRLQTKKDCDYRCEHDKCTCQDDYYRHSNGTCVTPLECSPPKCKEDEVYNNCATACPITCANRNNPPEVCITLCVEECSCKPGLIRDQDGSCVLPEDCSISPPTCAANEEPTDCDNDCLPTCKTRSRSDQQLCSADCKPGCKCKEGFLKNDNNVCVPEGECSKPPNPPTEVCGQNEVYEKCKIHCPPQLCSTVYAPINCFAPDYCTEPGCNCKEGFLRNGTTTDPCIRREDCPKPTCPDKEVFSECGSRCELTCDNYGNPQKCSDQCVTGCFCKPGLVRNSDGLCVKPRECPPPQCGKDEVYSRCAPKEELTCANCKNPPRNNDHQCVEKCVCKDGLVKGPNGKCIKSDKCPQQQCGHNEVYTKCKKSCPPESCLSKFIKVSCLEDQACSGGCKCRKGYLRNGTAPDSPCIRKRHCQAPEPIPLCGPNEVFVRDADVKQSTCSNPQGDSIPSYTGCICQLGYVKNDNDECVDPKQCAPQLPQCGENQVFSNCSSACLKTCRNRFLHPVCTRQCKPACVCADGYLKHDDGSCVRVEQCSPPQCGPNEHFEPCPKNCPPNTCFANRARYDCDKFSKQCIPQCYCDEGYQRNKNNICVKTENCD